MTTQIDMPIFIVGAPRSGTTLLQYILRSHPDISLPTGESHFIIPLYRDTAKYGDLNRPQNVRRVLEFMYEKSSDFLDTDLHGMNFDIETLTNELVDNKCNTMPGIIKYLFEKNAKGEGKPRWGDKTPYYALHIPVILEMFPNAQIVHLIRDGRDCALSLFNRKHDFYIYNTYLAAKYWQQYVDTAHMTGITLSPKQYIEIRYEDLLNDQRSTTEALCDFLGIKFDESVINFKKSGEAGKTPLLQKGVQKTNAEKWRKSMSQRQICIFESAAGDTLERHGYRLDKTPSRLPLVMRAIYRWHNNIITYIVRKIKGYSK